MYPITRRIGRATAALLFALIALSLTALPAPAATTQITEGSVDWGIKQSFRAYVLNFGGAITPSGGVTVNGDDTFRFPVVSGSYNDFTGETRLELAGSLHIVSHLIGGVWILDTTLSGLNVVIGNDGAFLRGDSVAKQLGSGVVETYNDIPLVALNIETPSLPQVAGGRTTWPALPSTLTAEGVPVFGNYSFGTAFDPVTIDYAGPGGRPTGTEFLAPGTPVFAADAQVNAGSAPIRIFHDDVSGVVHLLTAERLLAFDADSLAYLGAQAAPAGQTFWKDGNTFDQQTGTVFTTTGADQAVLAYTWDPASASYTSATLPLLLTARRTLVFSSATSTLYSIETVNARSYAFSYDPPASEPQFSAAVRDGGGAWNSAPGGTILGLEKISDVVATSDGKLIATLAGLNEGGVFVRKPVVRLENSGATMVMFPIPGTKAAPDATVPAPDDTIVGTTLGWIVAVPQRGGGVLFTDLLKYGGLNTLMRIAPDASAAPSGFAEQGARRQLSFQTTSLAFDATNDDLYAANGETVTVLQGDDVYASVEAGEKVLSVAGGDQRIYALTGGAAPFHLSTWSLTGEVPSVTKDPADVSTSVPAGAAGAAVSFSAAGAGEPAPKVQWQRRTGGGPWQNIAGATSDAITFVATTADNGAELRALYSNAAGDQASKVARLGVSQASAPPAAVVTPPAVKSAKKTVRLRRSRAGHRVVVGTVECPAARCTVKLPESIRFKVRSKRYKAVIDGPAAIDAGRSAKIIATLPSSAQKRLRGRTATLRVKLTITIADQPFTRTLKLKIR